MHVGAGSGGKGCFGLRDSPFLFLGLASTGFALQGRVNAVVSDGAAEGAGACATRTELKHGSPVNSRIVDKAFLFATRRLFIDWRLPDSAAIVRVAVPRVPTSPTIPARFFSRPASYHSRWPWRSWIEEPNKRAPPCNRRASAASRKKSKTESRARQDAAGEILTL